MLFFYRAHIHDTLTHPDLHGWHLPPNLVLPKPSYQNRAFSTSQKPVSEAKGLTAGVKYFWHFINGVK
jgi:hypothetical protein